MGQLSNSHVAAALGMSHSSVSRMRAGERVASPETLQKLVAEFDADPGRLLAAADRASRGEVADWRAYLTELLADGEVEEPQVASPV